MEAHIMQMRLRRWLSLAWPHPARASPMSMGVACAGGMGRAASRLGGRFLFKSGSHLILLDPSARCARLVEVLLFRAIPHHSCMLVGRFLVGRPRWLVGHGKYSVRRC